MAQKTTVEIKALITKSKLNYDTIVNAALNHYLPKIFHFCPFTDDVCLQKQCLECTTYKTLNK